VKLELRDYQKTALQGIWSDLKVGPSALCVIATGGGKSVIIAALSLEILAKKPDAKILILFNKVTLLEQLAERFKSIIGDDSIGVYCGSLNEKDDSRSVTVASIQSLKKEKLNFDAIIIDECHALNEGGGRYIEFINYQLWTNPKLKVVGFTATPFRSDDGYIYGDGMFFKHPSVEFKIPDLIDMGFLVHPICKKPEHQIDTSKLKIVAGDYSTTDVDEQVLNISFCRDQVVDALSRMQDRKKIVWFCSSIKHAEMVESLLNVFGETTSCVHSQKDFLERKTLMDKFSSSEHRHLVNVSVAIEGWDEPATDCVVLLRPTRSPVLMVQACGRGLRPYNDKKDCLILDFGGVFSSLGTLDNPIVSKKDKGGRKGDESKLKHCPDCRAYNIKTASLCANCGYSFRKELNTKELTTVADTSINILGTANILKKLEVKSVTIAPHVSKSGNECVRITYRPANFLDSKIDEYFVYQKSFSFMKMQARLIQLGVRLVDGFYEQCRQTPTRTPSYIEYIEKNKYPEIKSIYFKKPKDEQNA